MTPHAFPRLTRTFAFFLATVVSTGMTFFIFFYYSRTAVVHWDEAHFLNVSYQVYDALRHHDLTALSSVIHGTGYTWYPPLQSILLGSIVTPLGFTIERARAATLVWFFFGSILTYYLGTVVAQKNRMLVGFLSLFFFVTSPTLLYLSTVALKESMGIVLTIVTVLTYFWAREKKQVWRYFVVSIALFLLFFTRYQLLVLPLAAIGIETMIQLIIERKKMFVILSFLALIAPLVIAAFWWLLYPFNKLQFFTGAMFNSAFNNIGPLIDLIGTILYYPRGIYYFYAISPLLGILYLVSAVAGFFYVHNARLRVLWLAFFVNIVLGTIHNINLHERYLATTIPFLFVISAVLCVNAIHFILRLRLHPIIIRVFIGIICAVFLIRIGIDLTKLPNYVYTTASRRIIAFNLLDYHDAWFNYDSVTWPKALPGDAKENPMDVFRYIGNHVDLSCDVRVVGRSSEFSPPLFELFFTMLREKGTYPHLSYPSYTVTVRILPTSRLNTFDFFVTSQWMWSYIDQVENDPANTLIDKNVFQELGVEVKIFVPAGSTG